MKNSEIMKQAYASLKGKWGIAIATLIIYVLIAIAAGAGPLLFVGIEFQWLSNITSLVIVPPLAIGLCIFSLNISRDSKADIDNLFLGFQKNWINYILAYILMVFVIAVGFFLFIIPGVIASLMFSQVFFIMAEDDEIGAYDALVKSYNIMKGYKWKFFKINLRIMALAILCIFTLGIGFIWLSPYQYVVFATFYDDIKDKPSFKNQEYLS